MLIRKVDHVFVSTERAEEAHRLLTHDLGLPEAWPFGDWGFFRSGGVTFGNANFELLESPPGTMPTARLNGLAFAPVHIDDAFVAELDRRGLLHGDPMPHVGEGRTTTGHLWTNLMLGDMVEPGTMVFFCEYHEPEGLDEQARHTLIEETGGGQLGATGIDEIVLVSTDVPATATRWDALLGPSSSTAPIRWQVGDGPAIRLEAGATTAIDHVVISVRDVDAASAAIHRAGLDAIDGLDQLIRLRAAT